jgi:predicted secreted hydrolase
VRRIECWLALFLSLVPQGDPWRRIEPGLALEFPRDHGAHLDTRTEWWYVTGELADENGARFGFQFTIFRRGLEPGAGAPGESPLRARHIYAGHLALTDVDAQRTRFAERLARSSPIARASEERLELVLEDWELAGDERKLALDAADPVQGFGLELEFTPEKPLVRHGVDGYSAKGSEPGNASAYVSWTRLAVRGKLTLDGRALDVQGGAWFDHEFGSSVLESGTVGWDWFGLRLDDGRELMVFGLRDEHGNFRTTSAGTLVERDGTAHALAARDFALTNASHWTSPHSGGRYPAECTLRVPAHGLELRLRPLVPDCELRDAGATGVVYWEGPVDVTGSVAGSGYVERTGYAGSLAGRF